MARAILNPDKLTPRIRGPVKDDWNFVLSCWKNSYRDSLGHIPGHLYWPNYSAEVDRCLERAHVLVACDPERDDFIWGWTCADFEVPCVHYVFVRMCARKQGVATALLGKLARPIQCSYWTRDAEAIAKAHPGLLVYAPSNAPEVRWRVKSEPPKE